MIETYESGSDFDHSHIDFSIMASIIGDGATNNL